MPDADEKYNNTILMITTRQLCYSSAVFFAARLSESLERIGFAVEMCELDSMTNTNRGDETVLSEESERKLEQYVGRQFYAVIDINSRLPRMIMDDGSYYLDHIDAPFYDYILDHPLYHHRSLCCKLKNFHVIMVDEKHCDYVRAYYPHIRSVMWQTLGATEAVNQHSFEEKKEEILFPGTYRDPQGYLELMQKSRISSILLDMTDRMLSDPSVTIADVLRRVLEEKGLASGRGLGTETEEYRAQFTELLNEAYPVELYVRNYHRKAMIDALITAHVPLTIAGEWWEHYSHEVHPDLLQKEFRLNGCVVHEHAVTFAQSFERIAKSSVLVDSSPFFLHGIHDRVFAGMANHTAVLTDWNSCKQELLESSETNGSSAGVTYRLSDPKDLVDHAEELLINRSYRREIVDKGYEKYRMEHTWDCVAQRIADQIRADHD